MLQVLTTLRVSNIPASGRTPENLIQLRVVRLRKVEPLKTKTPMRSITTLFQDAVGIKPVDVVEFPLQGITENVISLCDPLEAFFSMMITWIDIRMKPAGQLPKSPFDVVLGGGSTHLKNDVKIFSAGHGDSLMAAPFT